MTSTRTLILQPTRGWRSINLHEIWAYREPLFAELVRILVDKARRNWFR